MPTFKHAMIMCVCRTRLTISGDNHTEFTVCPRCRRTYVMVAPEVAGEQTKPRVGRTNSVPED